MEGKLGVRLWKRENSLRPIIIPSGTKKAREGELRRQTTLKCGEVRKRAVATNVTTGGQFAHMSHPPRI